MPYSADMINMKKQTIFRIGLLVFTGLSISACSPFGNQSLIQDLTDQISIFIPGKTSTSVISSASSTLTMPASGQPYKVTHSVGDTYQQPSFQAVDATQTPTGYRVYSSVSGDLQ